LAETNDNTAHRSLGWKQVGVGLMIAVVASLAGVGANAALSWYQARAPELVYAAPGTIPFVGSDKQLAVYQITITNRGKRSVKDMSCYIEVPGAHVDQTHIDADKSAQISETATSSGSRVNDAELNPGEKVVVSILVSSSVSLPPRPTVSLRASGVMGKEETNASPAGGESNWGFTVLASFAAGLSIIVVLTRSIRKSRQSAVSSPEGEKHSGDQRQILGYLFGLNGLIAECERVLSLPIETSYWAEADRMSTIVLSNFNAESAARYKSVLEGLLKYGAVADESQGIISFNIARIAARMGHNNVAEEHLKMAKKKMGKLFDLRLEIDPTMKEIYVALAR
jgi:hypothetical protein